MITENEDRYLIVATRGLDSLLFRVHLDSEIYKVLEVASYELMMSTLTRAGTLSVYLSGNTSLVTPQEPEPNAITDALEALAARAWLSSDYGVVIPASEYPDKEFKYDVGDDVWMNVYGPDSVSFETYWMGLDAPNEQSYPTGLLQSLKSVSGT